jgi:hypothetical protein
MDAITANDLKALLQMPGLPRLSLFLPTHPGGGEQDPIQFKNLVTQAEKQLLERGMDEDAVKKLLRPMIRLIKDRDFWRKANEGLAFFLTPLEMRWYRLSSAFAPRVVIGARFFVKPLLPVVEAHDQFFVLGLNQKRIHLWEGDRNGLREVELKAMPMSLAEALRFHDRDESLQFHGPRTSVGGWGAVFSGQGVGIDTMKDDLLLYFQKIDRGLHDYLPPKAPLILAGVDYLWPIYRKANRHPRLMEHGIPGNSERWSMKELHDKAWAIVRDRFEQPVHLTRDRFAALAGTGRTCKEPAETIRAACEGRLETLMVAVDKETWGEWNPAANEVAVHAEPINGDEDLLNLAAIHAAEHGAKVFVLPAHDMPEASPIAGIYWTPPAKHG